MRPCIKLLLPLADTVRMRSMVYETVGRPSVCPSFRLSVPSFDRRTPLLWARRAGDIDRLQHGKRKQYQVVS